MRTNEKASHQVAIPDFDRQGDEADRPASVLTCSVYFSLLNKTNRSFVAAKPGGSLLPERPI